MGVGWGKVRCGDRELHIDHSQIGHPSRSPETPCYGTASCLLSYLINHASPILSNELSNTSVWMLWNSSLFNLLHFIIVWSCGHYYKV